MERKQNTLLIAIVAALLALVAAIVFIEPPDEDGDTDETYADLLTVQPEDVTRLHLSNDHGSLTAERGDGGWQIVSPWQTPGDDRALDDLVGLADRMEAEPPFDGGAPADFGLDAPQAALTLVLADGAERVLKIGDPSPVGGATYIDLDGGGTQLARGTPATTLGAPLESLREARLHRLASTAIDGIEWRGPEHAASLQKGDDGWAFSDSRRAKSEAIAGYLASISALRLDDFAAGAAEPYAELILTGGGEQATIQIGARDDAGWPVTTALGTAGHLAALDDLELLVGDLLDDRLIPFSPTELTQIVVALDDQTATIAADDERVSELVGARADRTAALPAVAGSTGTIEIQAGESELVIVLGQEVDGGRVAREAGEGEAFLVPDETLEILRGLFEGEG